MIKNIFREVSTFLADRPQIVFRIQQTYLKFGYSVLDLRQASWVIRRPEWLRERVFTKPSRLEPELTPEDGASSVIAGRLLAMFHSRPLINGEDAGILGSASNKPELRIESDSLWEILRESHYDTLVRLVKAGDDTALERYLGKLFRTKTVNGYTYGSTFDGWPHRWHYLPVQIELSIVQLAEALGLVRAECHEQGEVAFWRKLTSEHELIENLETVFGFRIEQPRCGDPRGIMFGDRFLTRDTCSHLYSAHKIRLAIDRQRFEQPLDIVEIGGGFGGTCYWLRKILGDRVRRYAIIDLPEVSFVQGFFLGSVCPSRLVLPGESTDERYSQIRLINYDRLNEVDFKPNILINQDSMPEMPESEVMRYLEWASYNLNGLFISFNQETYSMNGKNLQVCVPAVVKRFPRFRRISREPSWDRRGYVEEVYETI